MMCGIIGIISNEKFSVKNSLLGSLRRLEYRGYDSVGFASLDGTIRKSTGHITDFIGTIHDNINTPCAIAHTRWATHGGVTETNAHPHFDTDKKIFVVHNGIIENYEELKSSLEEKGYIFRTQTDSEVVAFYIEEKFKQGYTKKDILLSLMEDIKGTYAILFFEKGINELCAVKKDSPLVMGIIDGQYYLASDIYAFSNMTNQAIFFEDNEAAVISPKGYSFFNSKGDSIKKEIIDFEWAEEEDEEIVYPHYMLKEIMEEPKAALRLINSFKTSQRTEFENVASVIRAGNRVIFVACGTSYHASLLGVYMFNKRGINSRTVIASEIDSFIEFRPDDVVIAISQSGETMDVITVLKNLPKETKLISIVNVPHSTLQRMSDYSIEIVAGQEVCVAATKTFTNQLISLFCIANILGDEIDICQIPDKIQQTIENNLDKIKSISKKLYEKKDIFVLGRGASYPVSREIALKLKEIPYMHAEGMMAGELKHGTIALVEQGTPVITLISNNNPDMMSSEKEVQARGADTISISNINGELTVPRSNDIEFAIYACVTGHLLSYYIAVQKGLPIDKPRNLAKSVTVK